METRKERYLKELSLILEEVEKARDNGNRGYSVEELDQILEDVIESNSKH